MAESGGARPPAAAVRRRGGDMGGEEEAGAAATGAASAATAQTGSQGQLANRFELFHDGPMHIGQEDDEGSVEYKLMLYNPSPERLVHLVTQMKYRIGEGNGEAIYQVGVQDDGTVIGITPEQLTASLATLKQMAAELDASTSVIRERTGLSGGRVAEVLVRSNPKPGGITCDIRVAVAGNVDSGKSTLIGVLTGSGQLDNGNGGARCAVFNHQHEMDSG